MIYWTREVQKNVLDSGDALRHLGVCLELRGAEARSNMDREETGWDSPRSASLPLRTTSMNKEEAFLVEPRDTVLLPDSGALLFDTEKMTPKERQPAERLANG